MKIISLLAVALAVSSGSFAASPSGVTLTWTMPDGRTVSETQALVPFADGEKLVLGREKILAMKATRLDIVPDFARAKKGEAGYWFTPYGVYGEYDRADGRFFAGAERMSMPMFGWSNPRGACLAIVTSLKYFVRETVRAVKGDYTVAATLEEALCREPYEDLVIEYHRRPAGVPYAELAKIYRRHQLACGAVKPLRERIADNKVLERAVLAPEIRIRQAWKPVPSPVLHQAPENEPPVKAVVTFDRVKDIVDELKRQGVGEAELCLVGWNIGGHDGRWPQYFPAEPKLGGDAKLKEAIRHTLDAGYLIVPHGNFYEGYEIADNWSAEATIKDADGFPLGTRAHSWGGGKPYHFCPQRAYEMHTKIIPRLAAFGFRGIGYFDVVSICEPKTCRDPRHPCTPADGARFWGAAAGLSKRDLGGFASESGNDFFAANLDYSLYTYFGDPQKIESDYAAGKGLAKRVVPIWQIVYNGIIANNPFTTTMNAPLKDRTAQLKLLEFAARPCFYFYSKFRSTGTHWMGNEDLLCGTDEELRGAVTKIKEGYDAYRKVRHLQLEFVESHEEVAPGVFRTGYANGESVTVDYNRGEWTLAGAPERRLSLEDYRDKMAGAWIGQSVGVGYGWPTEFRFCEKLVPEEKMPVWKPESVNETFNQDDLYVEMTFIRTLETRGLDVSCREAGIDFANSRYRLWCANDRARDNLRRGIAAPDSGHPAFHASPDDIDYQIEADFSGILAPGLPQAAIRLGETFGRIMNYGDGLWAGQFVGGLYAAAYFSSDRVANVESALACIPSGSLYAQMVRDLLGWYRADPKDWQGAWRKAVDKYGRKGLPTVGKVSNSDINVKINGAMVLLGYLFGEGDPDRTMYIATRGGYDSDCNPSSACGVLFTSIGAKALPPRFTEKLDRDRKWEFTDYTYPKLMAVCEKLTRELVVREGGRIERDADGKEWFVIPARKPTPSPFWTTEKPGPVTNARYSPAEMEKVLYAPNDGMGRQSTRVRGKDYAKTPGRVRVTWDGHIWPGWNGILADWTLEGYADIAAQKPIRENDLFWAASNTKGVAAALVLTYVDEGRIGLDDPVEKYFPEWKDICVNDKSGRRAPKTKPTVRQVLSHTSGLPFFPKMPIDQYSMRTLVTMAVEKGLDTDPGANWRYSNWGIDIAVAVVEQVAGQPWEKVLQERILDPLDMKDTTFWPTTNQLARIVVPYHFPTDGGEPIRGRGVDQFRSDVTDRTVRHAEAGGGLYSTAGDFLKFYVMVARRGLAADGRRVLSEEICREWYRNQVPAELKKQYSFGMNVDPEKGTIGHGGAYATHAEANWKTGACTVDFVQKCGKPVQR